ncbi:hypothetical protein [Rhodococcus phage REQ1]|uniref:hypothetical protein n=1 Tax=Rhodococcus phage REQ1 TaxID=1109712 RepID=UPI00023EEC55|nr:hypothetical protein RoPhREQ1_gp51 [Rhodococcus phage REQ1]AEV52047.1 hypothetical protein [Rhodococcus phage REQ1]
MAEEEAPRTAHAGRDALMAVKLAAGVRLVDEGEAGEPAARLLILNQTTVNGWVEHVHVDLGPDEAEALGWSLIKKSMQLKEIRETR